MTIQELINALSEELSYIGDMNVVFRDVDGEIDPYLDVMSLYFDPDAERLILSDALGTAI